MTDGAERWSLPPGPANHVPLSPVSFLERAARVHGSRPAIRHGERILTYVQFRDRSRRLASTLRRAGIEPGQVVAVLAPNIPEMLEAHFGVPMAGAVLCCINTRLDAKAVRFILTHSQARVLIVDTELVALATAALADLSDPPRVVTVGEAYEAFLEGGDPAEPPTALDDEWRPIALNYTSGTTGDPKGAVLHHRGAYLNACGNVMSFQLDTSSVYLWTLPMFHCNGWTHTWAVTLAGGVHVCLPRLEPAAVFDLIARHGVTHLCGAPVVLGMLINAPEEVRTRPANPVKIATGGAAPPIAVINAMERAGFCVTHLYGMTECYGPSVVCETPADFEQWSLEDRACYLSRQGVAHPMVERVEVLDLATEAPTPLDGTTVGELVVRSNTVMAGYLGNPERTRAALAGGWLRTGDLAVMHPDGHIEIKDRMKDVIITGGENVSSLEVEQVLYAHPDVLEAAVVARPDEKWGETPQAFVDLKPGRQTDAEALIAWCRAEMAHFKCPRHVAFGPLPKTSTGKIQKFVLRDRARELAGEFSPSP